MKSKLFAQYYGQKAMRLYENYLVEVGSGGWSFKHPSHYLELKDASSLHE